MNRITINGVTIETNSSSINVDGDNIYVGGNLIKGGLSGTVNVEFSGDLASLKSTGSVTVKGEVKGNVESGGSCTCGNVGNSVDSGGSTTCGNVGGNVDAGGSIKMRR